MTWRGVPFRLSNIKKKEKTMKTRKKRFKLLSVVLALALVAGLIPSGLLSSSETVEAGFTSDTYESSLFDDFSSYESTTNTFVKKSAQTDPTIGSWGQVTTSTSAVSTASWGIDSDQEMAYFTTQKKSTGSSTYYGMVTPMEIEGVGNQTTTITVSFDYTFVYDGYDGYETLNLYTTARRVKIGAYTSQKNMTSASTTYNLADDTVSMYEVYQELYPDGDSTAIEMGTTISGTYSTTFDVSSLSGVTVTDSAGNEYTGLFVGFWATAVYYYCSIYIDNFTVEYSSTELSYDVDESTQTWQNYIAPYDTTDVDTSSYDDTYTYTTTIDDAFISGELTADYSTGSFENAGDWYFNGDGTPWIGYDSDSQGYYTNWSGTNMLHCGWPSSESSVNYVMTTVDVLDEGWYITSLKYVGSYAAVYLVADLGGSTEDGLYEVNDDGYTILATLYSGTGTRNTSTETVSYLPTSEFYICNPDGEDGYANVEIGLMFMYNSSSAWCHVDDLYLIGPATTREAPDVIYDDQIENGDFEYGSLKGWTVTNNSGSGGSDDTGYYGYTIESGQETISGTSKILSVYNNIGSEVAYDLTLSEYIRMNTGGDYKFKFEYAGRWNSSDEESDIYYEILEYDTDTKETGDLLVSGKVDDPEGWYNRYEYVSDAFTVTDGQVIQVVFYIYFAEDYAGNSEESSIDGSALALDNLEIVSGDYVSSDYTKYGSDQFADADFESWNFSDTSYWNLVSGSNDNDDYTYGYSFSSAVNWSFDYYTTDYTSEDPVLSVYNNQTDATNTLVFQQAIKFTEDADYYIQADLQGYFGETDDDGNRPSSFTITAYDYIVSTDEEGNITKEIGDVVYTDSSLSPYSNNEFNTETTEEVLSVSEGDCILFQFTVYLSEAVDPGDGEDAWQTNLNIDTIRLKYVSARDAEEDDLGYSGVTYLNQYGNVELVNGGELITGVDISSIISLENAGVTFADEDGQEGDLFDILADSGVNYVRVRVWIDPYSEDGANYGGGVNDIDTAVAIAKRAANAGLKLYVDFHISDFYTDPSHYVSPKSWSNYSTTEAANSFGVYVTESLEALEATGVDIGIVSIGNETQEGQAAGYNSITDSIEIFQAGSGAVREFDTDGDIMIAIHVSPTGGGYVEWFASYYEDIDYDIFAASYYAYSSSHTYDGNMAFLADELNQVAITYNKLTLIAEYNWPFTYSDLDGFSQGQDNSSSSTANDVILNQIYSIYDDDDVSTYTYLADNDLTVSEEGQYNLASDVITTSSKIANCIGSFYWEPAWVGVGTNDVTVDDTTYSAKADKWSTFGCGTATLEGASYASWGWSSSVGDGGSVEEIKAMFTTDEETGLATPNSFTQTTTDDDGNETTETVYSIDVFGINGDDVNTPITEAKFQVSSVSNGTYAVRVVGEVETDRLALMDVGFKIFAYDSDGNEINLDSSTNYNFYTGLSTNVYTSITANGSKVSPDDGYYFYTYKIAGIDAESIYYFAVMPIADEDEGCAFYQEASKFYAVYNGSAVLIDDDEVGTLTESDFE